MELSPGLAQVLGNVALGWYSHALTDAEAVQEIESALRTHGADALLAPEDESREANA